MGPGDDTAAMRRILVIKWSALGDVVIATAAVEDLARHFPGRQIDLNTLPPFAGLFAHDPRFTEVVTSDLRGRDRGVGGVRRWLAAVRGKRYDLIVDLQGNDRSRFLLGLLRLTGGARHVIGTRAGFPYTVSAPALEPPIHAFAHQRAALRAAGIETTTTHPVLHPGPDNAARIEQLRKRHGLEPGRYAVLIPGCQAAGYLKRWGEYSYVALAHALRDAGQRVAIVGGPDELAVCEAIAMRCGDWVVNLCGETAVLDLPPLCAGASVVVGNDTGPAHIAAATAQPMIVICGPTDPRRVRPVSKNVVALQSRIYCVSCYRKHCTHHACMQLVSPDHVMTEIERLWGRGETTAPHEIVARFEGLP